MSRRFVTLLERSAGIRQLIEREESSAAPRSVRLMRLKKLQLQLSESLRDLSAKQLIRHEPCAAQLRTDFTRLRS